MTPDSGRLGGEFLEDVFPAGEAAVLTVRITAAILVAFLPGRAWQGHLELIWKLQSASGVNWPALRAAECLVRRTRQHPDGGSARC